MKSRRTLWMGIILIGALVLLVMVIPTSRNAVMAVFQKDHYFKDKSAHQWEEDIKAGDSKTRGKIQRELNFNDGSGDDPLPVVLDLLKSQDENVRAQAAIIIKGLGTDNAKTVLPVLVAALNDQSEEVRKEAASALSYFGSEAKPAVPTLIQKLKDDKESVREWSAVCLAAIGSDAKDALPALKDLVNKKDETAKVKVKAGQAIWSIDNEYAKKENIPEPKAKRMKGPTFGG